MQHRGLHTRLWLCATVLFALPFIVMQLTHDLNWGAEDFAVFGVMLILACGLYEIATDLIKHPALRIAAAVALATAFGLVWAELAVGLFR